MKNSKEIANELRDIAPKLAALEKVNPYSVPENYFVNFKVEMLERVKLSGAAEELNAVAPTLAGMEKKNLVEVPANYFVALSVGLLKQVRANDVADELKSITPVLWQLEKKNAFEVSNNYFTGFPEQMMKRIALEGKPQVTTGTSKWLTDLNNVLENIALVIFKPKYTVAFAGVAATVMVGVMMFVQIEQCNDLDCKMASLTDSEINSYLDNNSDSYKDEIFESAIDENQTNNIQIEGEMLSDVSDADLNNAILD